MSPAQRTLLLLFFASGTTALVYQVAWTRLLTLSLGSTTLAVSTVLTAFMGGLALGSALLGRRADRLTRPAWTYGLLELLIGLYALATPWLFPLVDGIYLALGPAVGEGFWPAVLLRAAVALVLLLPPTVLMGGTLPVVAKVFVGHGDEGAGVSLSRLYAVNTAGAVLGCLATGMVLIQTVGVDAVVVGCGVVNLGIFAVARRLPEATEASPRPAPGPLAPEDRRTLWLAVHAAFASGLAALVYEVVWTRVLAMVMGSSTYAFTLMLATFLVGIALGSAASGQALKRGLPALPGLALCQLLIGVCALATASAFGALPDLLVALFGVVDGAFLPFLLGQSALAFYVMVPATLFMGASFPLAIDLVVAGRESSGARVGLVYAANTMGAILGAFAAGFVLVPLLGVQTTLVAAVWLNLLTAGVLGLGAGPVAGQGAARRVAVGAALVMATLVVWQPAWDRQRMTSGAYAYARTYQEVSIDDRLAGIELLFYEEGPVATVSVIQEGTHRRLVVDGKTDAGNHQDMTTQVLLGQLPLLLRPDAQDVLVIGFASGITAGAVATHPVARIDCVEIEPAMRPASAFFTEENGDVLADPRMNLIIDDGRSFLRQRGQQYDVIISEPSNPWQAGSSRLFTREAIADAAARLRPEGVFVQWMHLYGVDTESLRLVVRTVQSVFPHVSLWLDHDVADALIVSSMVPHGLDPLWLQGLGTERPRAARSLAGVGYDAPWRFAWAWRLGTQELLDFAGAGPINVDNLPLLEFRAPRALYDRGGLEANQAAIAAAAGPAGFPEVAAASGREEELVAVLLEWAGALEAVGDVQRGAGARGAAGR